MTEFGFLEYGIILLTIIEVEILIIVGLIRHTQFLFF